MQIVSKLIDKKVLKVIGIIIAIPFVAYIINLVILAIVNLGQYTGTFLRNLYDLVC